MAHGMRSFDRLYFIFFFERDVLLLLLLLLFECVVERRSWKGYGVSHSKAEEEAPIEECRSEMQKSSSVE